jgi:hypothetical protein
MTLVDNSNTGDLTLTGDLAVNGNNITSSGNIYMDAAVGGSITVGSGTLDQMFLRTDSGTAYQDIYLYGGVTFDDEAYFALGVAEDVFIEKTSATTDVMRITSSAAATNDGIDGLVISHTTTDSDESTGLRLTVTNTDNATAADDVYGMIITIDDNSTLQDDRSYGIYIDSPDNGVADPDMMADAFIVLANNDNDTADAVTHGILFDSQSGLITDAIDASHQYVVNAINIGANAIEGTYFDVAETTGAVILTRQATGTSPMTITGLADSTVADVDINTSLNQGTIIDVDYNSAETVAAALTGMSLNLRTNVTGATGINVTGYDVNMPALTSTSSTTYTGYDLSIAGAVTHSTAGIMAWRGLHVQMPNITQTSGTVQAGGVVVETGSITTGGTQSGVDIRATGVGAGSLNGVNISSITASTGTETAVNIGSGWDIDIDLQNGETIDNATDGTIALRDGNTALVAASLTALQLNLDDTTTYTQRLCHSQADGWTGVANVGDCNAVGQADYAEIYPTSPTVSYGDIVTPGSVSVITEHGQTITQLEPSGAPYQNQLLGVAVDNWEDGSSIGYDIADADRPLPVALVGRVMVHVTDENGAIVVGDPITSSSTAGYGMKATEPGSIIGFALDAYTGSGAGEIMVYVSPTWYAGNVVSTDGSSTYIADETILAAQGEADAAHPTYASYGLALRGSAWNGSSAIPVDMKIRNDVTDADHYRLSIRNIADTEVAYITNEGTLSLAGDLMIAGRLYPSDRGTTQSDKYIYYDGSSGMGGDFMRTNASGWATGSYDFAEMFPSDEVLESGDVVVFAGDGAKVHRAGGGRGDVLAGIVSTRPGFLAGENEQGAYPIALAGRVPAKVNLEGGAIAVGDALTASSTSGYAKKATEPGMIVGYALEPYEGAEGQDDIVITFVSVGYFDEDRVLDTGADSAASGQNPQSLSSLSVSGGFSLSGYDLTSIGRLVGVGEIWSIEADGTVKTTATLQTMIESYQGEKVITTAVTSPQAMITLSGSGRTQLGSAIILFEEQDPSFNDVISATAPIYVIVTPNAPVSLYVSSKDQNGFVVQTAQDDPDTTFDWMVSAYRKDYEPEEMVTEEPVMEEVILTQEITMEEPITEEISTEEVVEDDSASSESPIKSMVDESAPASEGDIIVEPLPQEFSP